MLIEPFKVQFHFCCRTLYALCSMLYALKVNAFSFIYVNLLKVNALCLRKPVEARRSPQKPTEARGSLRIFC